MIYLDNGATSFPKPKGMLVEMENCIAGYCGNPGRSGHYMSTQTGEAVYNARKKLAELLGISKPERLIFTKNTTEALNIALFGALRKGDHVITTSMEHNSVLRPLKRLENMGVSHTIVKANITGEINVSDVEKEIRTNTKMIVITAASNITGTKMPIEKIGKLAKARNILFLLDGAQSIGHEPFDIYKTSVDMVAFPGHKGLLGPQGTGGLYVGENVEIEPLIYGGTGTASKESMQPLDFPEGFEGGTVNSPGIIGLGYSVDFLRKVGVETLAFQEGQLIKKLDEELRNMSFVKVYGPTWEAKTGITLFNIKGMEGEEVTERLSNSYNIAVRGGFHCAGLAHKTIGTWETGAVRVSVGPFNTRRDIDKLIDGIWGISR